MITDRPGSPPAVGIRSLTRDTVIYGIGGSASRLASVLFVPIFTRIFTPADYGALELLTTQITILTLFAMAGLNAAVFYHYRRVDDRNQRARLVGTALVVATSAGVLIGGIGLAAAPWVAEIVLHDRRYALAVALSFVWLPVNICAILALDLLRLAFRPIAYTVIGVGRNFFAAIIGVALVVGAEMGIAAVLVSQIVLGIAGLAIALWLTRGGWRPALDTLAARRLLAFGLPLIPAGLAYWVINYSDRFFLIQFRGLDDVGLYAIANKLASLVQLALMAFQSAWYPFAYARAQGPGHQDVFARVFAGFTVIIIPTAVGLGLFAREALVVVTTPVYQPAYPYVGMLALALAANGAYQIVTVGVALARRTWQMAATAATAAVVNLVLNLVLIPPLGLLGASISTLTAYATSAALLYLLAQRVYPVPYDLRPAAALVVAGGAVLAFGLAADGYTSATPWSPASTGVKAVAFLALAALAFRLLEPGPRHAIVESLAAHTFRRGRSPA